MLHSLAVPAVHRSPGVDGVLLYVALYGAIFRAQFNIQLSWPGWGRGRERDGEMWGMKKAKSWAIIWKGNLAFYSMFSTSPIRRLEKRAISSQDKEDRPKAELGILDSRRRTSP